MTSNGHSAGFSFMLELAMAAFAAIQITAVLLQQFEQIPDFHASSLKYVASYCYSVRPFAAFSIVPAFYPTNNLCASTW
jgi:hypothetical protein